MTTHNVCSNLARNRQFCFSVDSCTIYFEWSSSIQCYQISSTLFRTLSLSFLLTLISKLHYTEYVLYYRAGKQHLTSHVDVTRHFQRHFGFSTIAIFPTRNAFKATRLITHQEILMCSLNIPDWLFLPFQLGTAEKLLPSRRISYVSVRRSTHIFFQHQ